MSEQETSTLDHCTGRQLKELLSLASSDAEATRNWLLEIGDSEQLQYLLAEICAGIGQSGSAILQAVHSPEPPLEALVALKNTAKRLAAAAEAEPQKAAATLLYHLSIASALGHYGRNISSKDPAERLGLYKKLAAELSDERLAAVFANAVAKLATDDS